MAEEYVREGAFIPVASDLTSQKETLQVVETIVKQVQQLLKPCYNEICV